MINVGLIGLGQIGREVAQAIDAGKAGDSRLVAAMVRHPEEHADDRRAIGDIDAFLRTPHMDVVVEVAGQAALREYACSVLTSGKQLVALSVGAFADPEFYDEVQQTAAANGRRVLIPSGGIAGLDAIGSAAIGGLDEVVHTVRKPPRAFTSEQLAGRVFEEDAALLYDGPARQGVRLFPENVNVAAAVSLAGIGLDRTRLRVLADRTVSYNTHEVVLHGYFGRLRIVMENTPTENPKTGRIVALSVIKALRNLSASVVVGV